MKTNILTTILLLTSLFVNLKSQAQCHIDDWTALKALYESTDGDNWINNTGWELVQTSSPPAGCDLGNLFRVQLDDYGRVDRLELYENHLNGSIPPEIGNLSNLAYLRLQDNQLSGSIPSEIGLLSNLTDLRLNGNQLNGSIPTEIGNLSSLTFLWLYNNQLDGSIIPEIGNLSNLTHLRLDGNQLSGSIPPIIGNLNNLTDLRLGSNQLNGSIPDEIGNLNKLTILWLQLNQLSGSIPTEIWNLTSLTDLRLYSNQLSGNIPPAIGNLDNLTDLLIGDNQLSGSIPNQIGNLTELTQLWLFNNQLSGSIPPEIGNLIDLTHLRLDGNQLSGSIPVEIGNLSNLIYLKLRANQLSGSIPQQLGNLTCDQVVLNDNNLSGTVPEFNSVNELYLNNNNFSCDDLADNFNSNNQTGYFAYSPQIYSNVQSYLIDTNIVNNLTLQTTELPATLNNPSYQWKKNDANVFNANSNNLIINDLQLSDAGIYTLYITDDCVPGMEFISKPYYVIYPGFDFYGQPVEYNEIMVEFDNPATTQFYENELLVPNASMVADSCNCNRELYLWKFTNTEDAMDALLEIAKKLQNIKEKESDVDGGFNNYINVSNSDINGTVYDVMSNMTSAYPDDVTIYLLDTGLDETGISNTPHLMPSAPVDNCYAVSPASGYNYTGTSVDNIYVDENGHGTYGFRSITDELSQKPNSIDVVPLKIFDENGEGNLFDLTCAVYHAIDHGADIINISAGYKGQPSSILEKAINSARENGIFVCTASGNDTLDIDVSPQYPACFTGQYHYEYDDFGNISDSTRYDNVISIAAIDAQNNLAGFSNYGQQSVTMSAYGKNIHSYGLGGADEIWSGTSMAVYYVSRELALEIARNKNRAYQQIWMTFENNSLIPNAATIGKTRTAKQLNVSLAEYVPPCTGCNCNNRMSSKVATISSNFGSFANDKFINNYITAEKSYINHRSEIHNILESNDAQYNDVQQHFKQVKDMALTILFQSFIGKSNTEVTQEHIQLIDKFLVSLSKSAKNKNLKSDIENVRKYLYTMEGKEVKDALIAFDKAGLTNESEELFETVSQIKEDFSVQLINSLGRESYLTYQSNTNGIVYINLFDIEGRNVQQSFQQNISEGVFQHQLSKQSLSKGIYYIEVHFVIANGDLFNEVLKLTVVQ